MYLVLQEGYAASHLWLCSKSLSGVQVLFGVDATDLASTLPQAAGHRYTVEGFRSSLMSGMAFFQQILANYFVVFLWIMRIRYMFGFIGAGSPRTAF